jgi:hypothetical protein
MPRKPNPGSASQSVRNYIEQHPDANPKQIVDGLAAKGVKVSIFVAKNVKYAKPAKAKTKASAPKAATKDTGVSKSESVRQYLAANSDATPKQVSDALAKQGIKASPTLVSGVKFHLAKKGKSKKAAKTAAKLPAAAGNGRSLSLDDLVEAKKLADRLGGLDKAKAALEALAKLV